MWTAIGSVLLSVHAGEFLVLSSGKLPIFCILSCGYNIHSPKKSGEMYVSMCRHVPGAVPVCLASVRDARCGGAQACPST